MADKLEALHNYSGVRAEIVALLHEARHASVRSVNALMTATYWEIGRRIVEFEQQGQERAEYGEALIKQLAVDLTRQFGRGFGAVNLSQMRRFYLAWPPHQIFQTPSEKSLALSELAAKFPLPWSSYVRLLSVKNPDARSFYQTEALRTTWLLLWSWRSGNWRCEHWRGTAPEGDDHGILAQLKLPTDRVWLLQIGGDTVPHRFVAIPPSDEVEIVVRGTAKNNDWNGGVGIRATTQDAEAEALMHYEVWGAIESAALIAESIGKRLGNSPGERATDANGTALGFYSLLANQQLGNASTSPERFAMQAEWLPDASLISAMYTLATRSARRKLLAKQLLIQASGSALPVYTRGLRVLFDQLGVYKRDPETPQDLAVDTAIDRLTPYAAATDWNSVRTSFFGTDPGRPSPEFSFGPSGHSEAVYLDFVSRRGNSSQAFISHDSVENSLINEYRIQKSQNAFEQLVHLHNRELIGYLRGRCMRKDDAEDIAQEAWVLVLDKIGEFDANRGNFIAFLKYHAQITALRWNRKNRDLFSASLLASELDTKYPAWREGPDLDIPLVSDLEDKFSVHQEYLKLLKLTFSTPSPPHQLLAFAFCKLLLWRPQRFVGELSELALSQVEERFRGTLTREIPEEADTVRKALGELRSMLRRKFDEAIEDPSTRSTYSNLSTHVLGETKMKDYFKLRPEQNVSHWIYAVRRRTLAAWSRQC